MRLRGTGVYKGEAGPEDRRNTEIRIQSFEIRKKSGPPGSAGSKLLLDKERAQAEAYAPKA